MSVSVLPHEPAQKLTPYVSIVVPVFNEVENLPFLYLALRAAMDRTDYSWEVVFVDDGSTDGTASVLGELYAREKAVRVVELRRNFGQTSAMAAGFDHARGEIIIAIDGDLQNDPKDIPRLIDKLNEGYDVVSGWRANREDGFWASHRK
jgi:glycosyltransferase involved in cell wall biosynthesis